MLLEKHLVIHRIGVVRINHFQHIIFKTDKIKILMELKEIFQIVYDLSQFSISIIEFKSILRKLYELFLYGDKTILFTCYIDNIIGI